MCGFSPITGNIDEDLRLFNCLMGLVPSFEAILDAFLAKVTPMNLFCQFVSIPLDSPNLSYGNYHCAS